MADAATSASCETRALRAAACSRNTSMRKVTVQGGNAEAFTQSTIRAVERCQPYGVLLDYPHDRWREIVVNFDPPPP